MVAHIKYRPDIDGLRAIAVMLVVGFHAFPSIFVNGYIGVDIFFVISGYLITAIILDDLFSAKFSFLEFFARRIRRIFPSLILVLAACFIAGWFILFVEEYAQLGLHMLGGASFFSNWILLHESGYFDNAAHTKSLLHLWSLGIEEQFYIVWPYILCAKTQALSQSYNAIYFLFSVFYLSHWACILRIALSFLVGMRSFRLLDQRCLLSRAKIVF